MRRPLLEASLGLAGGLLVATMIAPTGLRAALAGVAVLLGLLGRGRIRRSRVALLGCALGALHAARVDGALPADHVAASLGREPVLVTVRGRVTSAPVPTRSGRPGFDLEAVSLGTTTRRSVRGTLRVLAPPGCTVAPGDLVEAIGTARPGRTPTNPGEPDRGVARRRRGRTHLLVVERPGNLRVLAGAAKASPARLLASLRSAAAVRLARALPSPDAALASALLLGYRGPIPVEIEDAFRGSGTAHLLAVSGLHVGLVAGGLLLVLGGLRIPDPVRLGLLMLTVAGYAGLAGFRPPVVRAALVCTLYAGGRLLRRRTAPLELLGAAAFLLLMLDPTQAERLDFQLSFVAVLGLVLLTRRVSGALFPHRDVARRFAAWHLAPLHRRLPRDALHRMLPAAWSAWLATAPLVMLRFGVLTPVSLLGNLLLVPLLVVALGASVLALATGPALGAILALPLQALRHGAAMIAALPGASLECARPPLPAVVLAYGMLLMLASRPTWRRRHLAAASVVPFALFLLVLPRTLPSEDRLTVLDVGQGSAILLEQAAGPVMLYDAGSMTPEVGRRRIGPVLREKRIRRIDALVLSHADSDHVSAASFLIQRFRVGRLVVPHGFTRSVAGRRILGTARERDVLVVRVAAGDPVAPFGRVLHPPRCSPLSDNDGSLVLRVRLGSRTVLLTGDIEAQGCALLTASGPPVLADALLVPHHGGRNAGLSSLIRAVDPSVLLISAGRAFPAEPISAGRLHRRTSEAGAITVRPGRDGLRVTGFLERE